MCSLIWAVGRAITLWDAAKRVGQHGAVLALDTWNRVLGELHADAKRAGLTSILPVRADIAASLPVAAQRVDACLLAMVLHMPGRTTQLGLMLDEARRVLKPGGRLGILEHAGYDQLPRRASGPTPYAGMVHDRSGKPWFFPAWNWWNWTSRGFWSSRRPRHDQTTDLRRAH